MRILHYQRDLRLTGGGVIRFILDVCAVMAARGHEVVIASPDTPEIPAEWGVKGAAVPRFIKLPQPRMAFDLWGPRAVREVRQAVAWADVVHLHGPWWPTNAQLGGCARRQGVPYIVTVHGMLDDWSVAQNSGRKHAFLAIAGRRFLESAAAVHVTARGELDQATRRFRAGRTYVIPPMLNMERLRDLPGPDEAAAAFAVPLPGAPVVLFLSRVHPQKCPDVLIDAVAILKDRGIDCNLLIAGPGENDYLGGLTRRAGERGVADRTRLLGMVVGRRKLSLYQLADVFALPSPQESFGLVLVEAMACGTPAISTRTIDIWPELTASRAAVLTDRTPEAFAGAIERVLGDRAFREALVESAGAWVRDHLDSAAVASAYESMYADVCRKDGGVTAKAGESAATASRRAGTLPSSPETACPSLSSSRR